MNGIKLSRSQAVGKYEGKNNLFIKEDINHSENYLAKAETLAVSFKTFNISVIRFYRNSIIANTITLIVLQTFYHLFWIDYTKINIFFLVSPFHMSSC